MEGIHLEYPEGNRRTLRILDFEKRSWMELAQDCVQ
jgi:hypothetical protein